MSGLIATLNAGSSSVKFAFYDSASLAPFARGLIETRDAGRHIRVRDAGGAVCWEEAWASGAGFHADALARLFNWHAGGGAGAAVVAVGHRVVHGGRDFSAPMEIGAAVMAQLARLIPLAPLHQPHNLAGVMAARAAWPEALQVACFDTAFHRAHPFVSDCFALPRALYEQGVRRYGFHGLSYEYVTARLRAIDPELAAGRVVVAHLGNGASMCAVRDGQSVASTMGFTALDGLPMGTRCGQLDPGVVLYLIQEMGMTADAVAELLYTKSGLLGLSGLSGDMRTLEAAGTPEAEEAIGYYVARIRRELGGMAASLGGLDGLVFCGGIGENAAGIRARILDGMGWLGIAADPAANAAGAGVISAAGSAVRVRVIPTDEEAMIARHTAALIGAQSGRS